MYCFFNFNSTQGLFLIKFNSTNVVKIDPTLGRFINERTIDYSIQNSYLDILGEKENGDKKNGSYVLPNLNDIDYVKYSKQILE